MISDRKAHFIDELKRHFTGVIAGARLAEVGAAETAAGMQGDVQRKEDAKAAAQFTRVSRGLGERIEAAKDEMEALIAFAAKGVRAFQPTDPVGLGALVDVRIEDDDGTEERTLYVLPVGAGTELTGPGGDGFVFVVTPTSPVGRGLMGERVGFALEVEIAGRAREWSIVDIG